MTVLEILLLIALVVNVAIWVAARISFYFTGARDATIQSFKQFLFIHFKTGSNFIAFTDTAIKLAAFAALINWIWQQY